MQPRLKLPAPLLAEAVHWLDEIESRLRQVASVESRLSGEEAASLRDAIGDVRATLAFARQLYSAQAPLGQSADTRWVPLVTVSPVLAAAIHSAGDALWGTPWELIERGKASLEGDQRAAFVQIAGDVLGSIFTNFTRAVWKDYPSYAPDGWDAPSDT